MVQRKVLGIQADHFKSEKRLATLKTPSSQYQDGKKKMRKSRSIKLSDFESLSSSPLIQNRSQPGRPPPPKAVVAPPPAAVVPPSLVVPARTASPQKKSIMKASDYSPNYMKSTSSFEARKERAQVSPLRNNQPGSGGEKNSISSRRYSKHSKLDSASTLKTSSLKLVRTLTKTPTFKLARSSTKKCTQVALCTDINPQRATCSSTLKDSKFPNYLMLSPGATEYEGASAMKVCPYTYCSLNGHCHAPLPPLKGFMSARRRLLKTQKSMKLETLFPPKDRAAGEGTKDIDIHQVIFDKDKEEESGISVAVPVVQEGGMEFFIEIYAKEKEGSSGDKTTDFAENYAKEKEGASGDKTTDYAEKMENLEDADEITDGQVTQSLSDGSPVSEIDFNEELDTSNGVISSFHEENNLENSNEDYQSFLVQDEATSEKECSPSTEQDDSSISEASDMEWEEGQSTTSKLDSQDDETAETEEETGVRYEIESSGLCGKPLLETDVTVLQEVCLVESAGFEGSFSEEGTESDSTHQNLEVDECSQSHEQHSSTNDAVEKLTTSEERDRTVEPETDGLTGGQISVEDPIEEPMTESGVKNAISEAEIEILDNVSDDANNFTTEVADEAFIDQQEAVFCQDDDVNALLGNQITDSSTEFTETEANCNQSRPSEDSETAMKVATSNFGQEQQLANEDAGDVMEEKDQVDEAKSHEEIHLSDSFGASSESEEDNNKGCKMMEVCTDASIVEERELSQDFVDENLPQETQNLNLSEKDHCEDAKLERSCAMDYEEQSDSEMKRGNLAQVSVGEVDKMKVEDDITNPDTEKAFFQAEIATNQALDSFCNNPKGRIRCKKPIIEEERLRAFNPQEPNYLPVEADPEAEKVDLRHQMMDDRKNAEEWMLDYALRQAVTKLAPARNRRVALLVEAFETVAPIPKYGTHMKHTSAAFAHVRPIQACR